MEKAKRLKSSRYMSGLDGLRALAVIGVIFYHLTPHILPGGFLGVPIFFVLSGYLISDLLIQEFEQNGKISLKQFWKRRLNRLYPALVTMLILVTGWITIFERSLLLNIRNMILTSLVYLNNWWQISQGASYFDRFTTPSPFVHLWSLAIEGQFYLIWPVIVVFAIVFIKRNDWIFYTFIGVSILSALLMAILYVPGADPSRVYYGTDTRAFSLLIGSALAFIWPSTKLKKNLPNAGRVTLDAVGVLSLGLLIWLMVQLMDSDPFTYYGGIFIFSLISGILVAVVAHPATWLAKLLSLQPLKWIGQRSYGLYLWQYPVMILYEVKVGDTSLHPLRHLIIQITLIILISEASYRFVEMPFKKLNIREVLNWNVIVDHGKSLWRNQTITGKMHKVGIVLLSLILIISLVGFTVAPVGDSPGKIRLAAQLKANQTKIDKQKQDLIEQKNKEVEESAVREPLFGLTPEQMEEAGELKVTLIGDSVMLSVVNPVEQLFPKAVIDGVIGRQLYQTVPVVESLKQEDKLGNPVVIALGTNGAFTDKQMDDLLAAVGDSKKVYLVNTQVPKNWKNSVNQGISSAAKRHSNVEVIDWNSYSQNHSDWFYEDGVHPNETGAEEYTKLIATSVLKN
ncbi:acyltransferase family protein [Carnobacterium maltaromaticum]|jgi:peptidoglycan/LPS O-acetylase OafA/YrhL|uniref:Acyltransferase family protein n=1 Tax=Carnobacterium maltaromaticum LMA28 TaxID=1234679 RepID=K8E4N4_CARML|nr:MULTISPECIES: acyltransferase family protein [Carnobacterium]AOA02236.1 acyltransferase [Carnobacterium maltaromaticum]MBC9788520.1 acyltransferase family protein [Carnobacterium maltaromaticum]MBQ6485638.1 acetyltransferase [Carnobacterium sp.]MCI1820106.1 acetyltransferase [Carnobacterium maltaromaticum]MDW5523061.1 acyltransferase family protein [Carnobacterium maltaromaticum]